MDALDSWDWWICQIALWLLIAFLLTLIPVILWLGSAGSRCANGTLRNMKDQSEFAKRNTFGVCDAAECPRSAARNWSTGNSSS